MTGAAPAVEPAALQQANSAAQNLPAVSAAQCTAPCDQCEKKDDMNKGMSLSEDGVDFIYKREAKKNVSNKVHWPQGASGVTLGAGYDMKERTAAEVEADLKEIGVADVAAKATSGGAGKSGEDAKKFVSDNPDCVDLTEEQEKKLLKKILPSYEDAVKNNVKTKLNQNQYDALVSLCYNIGTAAFKTSSVVAKLNDCKYDDAAEKFKVWNKSDGKVNDGLTKRRNLEVDLFKKVSGASTQQGSAEPEATPQSAAGSTSESSAATPGPPQVPTTP